MSRPYYLRVARLIAAMRSRQSDGVYDSTINLLYCFVNNSRYEAIPTSFTGILSPVILFLLLTSVCGFLSLSTIEVTLNNGTRHDGETRRWTRIPSYVPDVAMLCVMSVGIVALVAFIVKRGYLTTEDHDCSSRHKLHRKYSLRGITVFFIAVCILGINYIVVEFSCVDRWAGCYDNQVVLVNVFELTFRVVLIAYASCEIMVCWKLQGLNFKRSRWIWHGLAVVQAANIALWFDSIVKESGRRINDDVHSFDAYFSLCNITHDNRNQSDAWCSTSSVGPRWLIFSCPFLYPIAIEFALLVSETFLRKVISRRSHSSNENAQEETFDTADFQNPVLCDDEGSLTEQTPLLRSGLEYSRTQDVPHFDRSSSSKLLVLIMNIAYSVLSILVFIAAQYKSNWPTYFQTFIHVFVVFKTVYMMCLIIGCAVGIRSRRSLMHRHSHTSFLEYLLLFATVGGLCRTFKQIAAYAVTSASSDPWLYAYYTLEVVDTIEMLLQIVLYYYARDVVLSSDGEYADSPARVGVFKNIVVVIVISNFALWISDSFLLPYNYFIEPWPVFDSVVNPIVIFFRFTSALLFWCIYAGGD